MIQCHGAMGKLATSKVARLAESLMRCNFLGYAHVESVLAI